MQVNRKDIGYTIYSRLEESFHNWIEDALLNFGDQWPAHIPNGVWEKVEDKSSMYRFGLTSIHQQMMIERLHLTQFSEVS